MEFVKVFHEVDRDNDGVINVHDLEFYCEDKKLSKAFVDKWLKLFDTNNDEKIEYDEFCQVLGVPRTPHSVSTGMIELQPNDPFKIFRVDMSSELQRDIVDIVRNDAQSITKAKDLARRIVLNLEKKHQRYWNVRVDVTQDQRVEYCHEGVIFFTINGRRTYLIWRTDKPVKKCGGCCGCF